MNQSAGSAYCFLAGGTRLIRRLLFALVFGLVGGGLAVPTIAAPEVSQQEVVRAWNDLALTAVRVTRASDADAARTYAILNVAVYDAVNGIVSAAGPRKRAHALVPGPGPRQGEPTGRGGGGGAWRHGRAGS